MTDTFGTTATLEAGSERYLIRRLSGLQDLGDVSHLPYSIKILLENMLRHEDSRQVSAEDIAALAGWPGSGSNGRTVAFSPERVLLQDFTGVPAIVDLAALRDALAEIGDDPSLVNPKVPVELVIDHSVIAEVAGRSDAFEVNAAIEAERNAERYRLLRWAQQAFDNFAVVPPDTGICHQINLEYLARVVFARDGEAFPDTLVGTDSHTPMVGGLGVLGWGVGGIEAEAAMLGQHLPMPTPAVVGVELTGELSPLATATDLVLVMAELLRHHGVVGKFVELTGPGLSSLRVEHRATLGNMAPEYGATCAISPIDDATLDYLRLTGRSAAQVALVEAYAKEQGLFSEADGDKATFSELVRLDLSSVEPSIAGPARPHDRVALSAARRSFRRALARLEPETCPSSCSDVEGRDDELPDGGPDATSAASFPASDPPSAMAGVGDDDHQEHAEERRGSTREAGGDGDREAGGAGERGKEAGGGGDGDREAGGAGERGEEAGELPRKARPVPAKLGGSSVEIDDGHVVIAAITSCTNTSNPQVMVGAGLLARKAVEQGLRPKPWVKASLAPGSRVVTDYLERAGLVEPLAALGFNLVGYGCTTCIGNSGPLLEGLPDAIATGHLAVCAVLSGNRNFEGRIHPEVRMNYLASPPLVIAYALAGTLDIDLTTEALGKSADGEPVTLAQLWPSPAEVDAVISEVLSGETFTASYADLYSGDERWRSLGTAANGASGKGAGGGGAGGGGAGGGGAGDENLCFSWQDASTYVRQPPFLEGVTRDIPPVGDIVGGRVLAVLGDSVTTDHISPAGSIPASGPAGSYLSAHDVERRDFNSFGARRGNHEVMVRGTFANVRLRNLLVEGVEGGFTRYLPNGETLDIFEAANRYRRDGTPLVVLAGSDYGAGSSRDWAAKGTLLLGVRAVLAQSFERIHRSNLIGMGVLPLQFTGGASVTSLGLTGEESFDILGLDGVATGTGAALQVKADGRLLPVIARLDTATEQDHFRHGGILPFVLRDLART